MVSRRSIYVATMTCWHPRRDWFAAKSPAADGQPKLREVWARNFADD